MAKKAINRHVVSLIGFKRMIQAGSPQRTRSMSAPTRGRALLCLNGGLVLLLAWLVGRLVWHVYTPPAAPILPPSSQVVTSQAAGEGAFSLAPAINAQLFGRFQASAQQRQQSVSQVPETRLQLTLVGVVASNQPSRALAVIANGGQQATYGVGEQVKGTQVSVDQVLSDRVILRQGTRREALLMPGVEADSTPQTVFSPSEADKTPPKPAPTSRQTSPDWPADLARQLASDPQRLFDYVQLAQVGDAKQLKGFRLTPGKNPVLFEQSGLQPGDIAVAINGLTLSRSVALPEILNRIQQQGTLDLVVERQGQQHDISIQL